MPVEQRATPRIIRLVVVDTVTALSQERKTLQRARQNWPSQIQEWLFSNDKGVSHGREELFACSSRNLTRPTTRNSNAQRDVVAIGQVNRPVPNENYKGHRRRATACVSTTAP